MKVTSRWIAALRLLLSVPVAFAVVAALSASGAVGSCGDNPAMSMNCNGGGGGPPPPPPPPPPATATPTPDWTWVEDLPSPSVVNGRSYTGLIEQCTDVLCVTTSWDYFENVIVEARPYDPCCMGAIITQTGALVAITSGTGFRTPHLYANGTIYRYDGYGNDYDRADWTVDVPPNSSSNCPLVTKQYEAIISGCTIYTSIYLDGANATDRFGLDEPADTGIFISGYAQSVPRKWY